MQYDELESRYGIDTARRVRSELHPYEFNVIPLIHLVQFLRSQAEIAHSNYIERLENPYINANLGEARDEYMLLLRSRYEEADDLYRAVLKAEDVYRKGQSTGNL